MAETETKVTLDLDNKEFVKKLKESLGLLGELGKTENIDELAGTFLKVGKLAGLAAGAFLAVKTSIDWVEEAEKIRQVEASFNAMASSAGIAAGQLIEGLTKVSKGTIDNTDLMQSASKAIAELGTNASRLPEIMDMARKASALYGGTALEKFEQLNHAIAMQQTRQLKMMGIHVDAEKVIREYAAAHGKTVDVLTQEDKQQAILNATLQRGSVAYKGVNADSKQVTTVMQQITATMNDLKEAFILVFEKIMGPLLKQTLEGISYFAKGTTATVKEVFASGDEATKQSIESQKELLHQHIQDIAKMEQKIRDLESGKASWFDKMFAGSTEAWKKRIAEVKTQMDATASEIKRLEGTVGGEKTPVDADADRKKAERLELERKNNEKFEHDLLAMRQQRLQAQQSVEQSIDDVERNKLEEKKLIIEQYHQRQIELERQVSEGKLTSSQMNQMLHEQDMERTAKLQALEEDTNQRRIDALDRYARHSQTVGEGVSRTWSTMAEKSRQDNANMAKFGQIAFDSLNKNAANAFRSIGDGSKNASEAFKGFMYGAIGDVAEAKGQMLLTEGIATLNPAYVAAGGALIALGSYLKSQAGGKGEGMGGVGGGGGGAGGGGEVGATKPEAAEQHKKAVTVNIHGSYFETDQTRERMMDMIRQAGDFTDFNLKQIGQA